jgi:hypothetical protein
MIMACLGAGMVAAKGDAAGGESPQTVAINEEAVALNLAFKPKRLPPHVRTPMHLTVEVKVQPYSGPLRGISSMIVDLDRSIGFESDSLPVCSWPAVQYHLQVDAVGSSDCPRAVVGHGEATIGFAFPEAKPIMVPAPVTVYNGGVVGRALQLLIEIPVTQPLEGTLRLVAPVRQVRHGSLGSEMTMQMPTIAEGFAALVDLRLELDGDLSREGRPPAFVTASCRRGKLAATMAATLTDGTTAAEESIRACTS